MLSYWLVYLLAATSLLASETVAVKAIDDAKLMELIKSDYVVVLFQGKTCEECAAIENLLDVLNLEEGQEVKISIVKIVSSQLSKLYSPKEPALVFFRHGIPMLINLDEPWDAESLTRKITENVVPAVKELTDATFEHLTQASTGSTTGDWFVQFYSQKCVECQRLTAIWEGVASYLKVRLNVARVNTELHGVETGKRFNVQKLPEFILIRSGKFYRYEIKKYDIKSFTAFALGGYKNAKPEQVKVPATPFDKIVNHSFLYLRDFVEKTTQVRKEQPYVFMSVIGVLLVILVLITRRRPTTLGTGGPKAKRRKEKARQE